MGLGAGACCTALVLARLGLRRSALQLPMQAHEGAALVMRGSTAFSGNAASLMQSFTTSASQGSASSGGSPLGNASGSGFASSKPLSPGTPGTVPGQGPTPATSTPKEGPITSAAPAAAQSRAPPPPGSTGSSPAATSSPLPPPPPPSPPPRGAVPTPPVEHPGSNKRFQLLGWVIPLFGIPLMFFMYMRETHRTDNLLEELRKAGANVGIASKEQLQKQGATLSALLRSRGSAATTPDHPAKPAPAAPAGVESGSGDAKAAPAAAAGTVASEPGSSPSPTAQGTAAPPGLEAAPAGADAVPAAGPAEVAAAAAAGAASGAVEGVLQATASMLEQASQETSPAAGAADVAGAGAASIGADRSVPGSQQSGAGPEGETIKEAAAKVRSSTAEAASTAAEAAAVAALVAAAATPVPSASGAEAPETTGLPRAVPWKAPPTGDIQFVAKGTLGMTADLTPAALVQAAIQRGLGAANDWHAFDSAHRQAVADAQVFAAAVHEAQTFHAQEVAQMVKKVEEADGRTESVRRAALESAEQFRSLLKQHQQMASELRDQEVRQAEKRVLLHASEAWLAERKARLSALDEIRVRLGALSAAHDARAAQQAAAHESHALALGILGLTAALESGQTLAPALAGLKGAAGPQGTDPLLATTAATVEGLGAKLPTRPQLESEFRRTRNVLSELSYFPGTSAGMLAHAVARMATALKIDEATAVRSLGEASSSGGVESAPESVDAGLAMAEARLAAGDLRGAADAVEKCLQGTAAGAAAAAWVSGARKRAEAEQALQLLRAHASALAASLT